MTKESAKMSHAPIRYRYRIECTTIRYRTKKTIVRKLSLHVLQNTLLSNLSTQLTSSRVRTLLAVNSS